MQHIKSCVFKSVLMATLTLVTHILNVNCVQILCLSASTVLTIRQLFALNASLATSSFLITINVMINVRVAITIMSEQKSALFAIVLAQLAIIVLSALLAE